MIKLCKHLGGPLGYSKWQPDNKRYWWFKYWQFRDTNKIKYYI